MIKFTLCLIIGILFAHVLETSFWGIALSCFSALIIFIMLYFLYRNRIQKNSLFGIISYTGMISIGLLTYTFHNQQHWSDHYSKFLESQDTHTFQIQITERLKPGMFHEKYIVNVIGVNQLKVSGQLLLYLTKGDTGTILNIDDRFVVHTGLKSVKGPSNPDQFNYKEYLKRQYIYHQMSLSPAALFPVNQNNRTLKGYANQIRSRINDQLALHQFNDRQMAIINALFLGQRQDMSPDMYTNYARAGAIHILAISGLHIGIILFMLNRVLMPLEYLPNGRLVKALIILILLWSFAIIAGLSASISRAVTMFSLVTIAMHLKRPTNIYNTLSISIFVLLLVQPMFLFDVGFQLSYVAVLAIVSIQPKLKELWTPKLKPLHYLWQILSVTVAAQLGVAPLSLFYFHQFPGLFFVSNLAIIPFLGFILGFGLVLIGLAFFNLLPEVIAKTFAQIIDLMNAIVEFIASQDQFVLKNISFELPQLICSYLIILLSLRLFRSGSYQKLISVLCVFALIQVTTIDVKLRESSDTLIIFHKNRKSILGFHKDHNLKVCHNLDSVEIHNSRVLEDYCVSNFISSVQFEKITNVYRIKDRHLLVVDSLGIYNPGAFKPDYVLLRNSPKINLHRLIDSLQPIQVIADGSNYRSYVERWKGTCEIQKIPFHSTYEKGAIIFK